MNGEKCRRVRRLKYGEKHGRDFINKHKKAAQAVVTQEFTKGVP